MSALQHPHARIVCAALRLSFADERGDQLVIGPRHHDPTMKAQIKLRGGAAWKTAEQGFINTHGEFLSREAALHVALLNDQRIRRCGGDDDKLFSENLY